MFEEFLPENVEERNILTSDGSFGGRMVNLPCNISSYRRIADLISGKAKSARKWKLNQRTLTPDQCGIHLQISSI